MGISLAKWAALAPQISYWLVSAFFETLEYFDLYHQYRVIPFEEDALKKNQVSKLAVLKYMVINSTLTTVGLFLLADYVPMKPYAALPTFEGLFAGSTVIQSPAAQAWASTLVRWGYLAARQFMACLVMDSWQFWCHYTMHRVPWLYRNIHAVHHKLYVPYAYAALYNHWAESLISDNIGGVLGTTFAGLTDWEQVVFYSWVMAKTVEDHSGYALPFSPLIILARYTGAGVVYHNIHHQTWGLKTNFQIYFTFWDRIMNTVYSGNRKLMVHRTTPAKIAASHQASVSSGAEAPSASVPADVKTPRTRHRLAREIDALNPYSTESLFKPSQPKADGLTPETNGEGNLKLDDLLGNGRAKEVRFEDGQ